MASCLVALDLDGTLLTRDSRIPSGHEQAVEELHRLGAAVAIVTGRSVLTSAWVSRQLRIRTPLVCFNGSWVGLAGGPPIATAALDQTEVRTAIAILRRFPGAISAYPDAQTWLMDREIPRTSHWREHYRVDIRTVPERFDDWHGPSFKLMFVTDPEVMPAALRDARARLGRAFHVVASEDDRFEILPYGITKAWGLERLARLVGIPRDDVWAVGDADNDTEMIAWAGHGCAMGHAHARVRGAARHLLPSIDARGVCAVVPLVERALATRRGAGRR